MATRFRLTQDTTAPAVSPALNYTYLHSAPATVRRKLLTSDSSALTNTAYTPDAADHAVNTAALWCQFVSDPMQAGKVFTNGDTIKFAVQGIEDHAANNQFVGAHTFIVSEDGSTVRRVLNSTSTDVVNDAELTTTLRNNFHSYTQNGANYTTVSGDRLVVEVFIRGTPGGGGGVQGHNGTMRFGGDGSSGDLPENDTETGTTFNPWIEFVPSDLFQETHSGSAVVNGGGAVTAAVQKGGQNSGAVSGGGALVAVALKAALAVALVTGGGAVTVTGSVGAEEHQGSSIVTGGGAVIGLGEAGFQSAPAISGGGSATGVGEKGGLAAPSVSGGGGTTGSGQAGFQEAAAVSGGGAVNTVAESQRFGTGTVSGGGAVTATGTSAEAHEGSASVSGGGSVSALGESGRSSTATATGGGSVSAVGASGRADAATITSGGSTTGQGESQRFGAPAVSGGGSVTAQGTAASGAEGSADVSGGGSVNTDATTARFALSSETGGGGVGVGGSGAHEGAAAVSGGGSVTVTIGGPAVLDLRASATVAVRNGMTAGVTLRDVEAATVR